MLGSFRGRISVAQPPRLSSPSEARGFAFWLYLVDGKSIIYFSEVPRFSQTLKTLAIYAHCPISEIFPNNGHRIRVRA